MYNISMLNINDISISDAKKILEPINNHVITKAWLGYAGVLFLEIGYLRDYSIPSSRGVTKSLRGEWTIQIHGHWKILKNNVEVSNYSQPDKEIINKLTILEKKKIAVFDLLPQNKQIYLKCGNNLSILIENLRQNNPWTVHFDDNNTFLYQKENKFLLEKEKPPIV